MKMMCTCACESALGVKDLGVERTGGRDVCERAA